MTADPKRDDLLTMAYALSELEQRRKVCPIAAMEPLAKQDEFSLLNTPIMLFFGGNQSGKTHILVAEIIAAMLGYRPWKVPGLRIENGQFPDRARVPAASWVRRRDGLPIEVPNKGLMLTGLPLARGIGEIVQAKFTALWPMDSIPIKTFLGPIGCWTKIIIPNGSELTFGAATQQNLAFEGFGAHYAAFDEPVPQRVYTAVRRGLLAKSGSLRWTLTPLADSCAAWMAADLLQDERDDVSIVRCSSYDNIHVDKRVLDEFFADPAMSEEERRARRDGEISALGRVVVSTFGDHAMIPATMMDPAVQRMLVVDPHHARLPFMVWIAVYDGGREAVVYREWPDSDYEKTGVSRYSIDQIAAKIKELEGREDVRWRVCDPAFGPQHARVLGQSYRSFVEEMGDFGLHFDSSVDNDLDRGVQELRNAFVKDQTIGRPRVTVMRNCKNLIRALSFWSYKEGPDGQLKPSENYKDPVDALRYGLMAIKAGLPLVGNSFSYIEEE